MAVALNPIIDRRSFCELVTHCEIRALASRIGTAVSEFFGTIVHAICNALVWICNCCDDKDDNDECSAITRGAPVEYNYLKRDISKLTVDTVKATVSTKEISAQRRRKALARLDHIKPTTRFECPAVIMHFNLNTALQKYENDLSPTKWIQWYDYAMPDKNQREPFLRVLNGLRENPENKKYREARHILSQIHSILSEKKARIDPLHSIGKLIAQNELKDEICHIIFRLIDANQNCIDQILSQLEDIAIEVISTENPLNKSNPVSLLQYKAAHALFRYRTNLITEILVKDQENWNERHMADLEREVKKNLAEYLGITGKIFEVGAQFKDEVKESSKKASEQALIAFWDQYDPVKYLQEQCRVTHGTARALRGELLQWATVHYGLGSETVGQQEIYDDLSIAVSKSEADLEAMCTIAGVELTEPGVQLFLEAAGIIQSK